MARKKPILVIEIGTEAQLELCLPEVQALLKAMQRTPTPKEGQCDDRT